MFELTNCTNVLLDQVAAEFIMAYELQMKSCGDMVLVEIADDSLKENEEYLPTNQR